MNLIQTKNVGFGSYLVIQNDLIGNYIAHNGFWEPHLIDIYKNAITKDDVILDAGANIGFHTLQFALLGKHVYAYEPQPIIFNLLTTNILLNGASDFVTQYRLGLGDTNTVVKMQSLETVRESNGNENYGGRGISKTNDGVDEIEIITFDKDVDVIKMDIQGYELNALIGMMNVIDRCQPWFILENYAHNNPDSDDARVLELLKNKGYVCHRLHTFGNEDCILFNPGLDKHKMIKSVMESLEHITYEIC